MLNINTLDKPWLTMDQQLDINASMFNELLTTAYGFILLLQQWYGY